MTKTTSTFEITSWDQHPSDEPKEGLAMVRATVKKAIHGDLEGTSIAEAVLCGGVDAGAYIAVERVTGTLGGRTGTFVVQHGGVSTAEGPHSFGNIVFGSGTGELKGLRGTAKYGHDENGARIEMEYSFD